LGPLASPRSEVRLRTSFSFARSVGRVERRSTRVCMLTLNYYSADLRGPAGMARRLDVQRSPRTWQRSPWTSFLPGERPSFLRKSESLTRLNLQLAFSIAALRGGTLAALLSFFLLTCALARPILVVNLTQSSSYSAPGTIAMMGIAFAVRQIPTTLPAIVFALFTVHPPLCLSFCSFLTFFFFTGTQRVGRWTCCARRLPTFEESHHRPLHPSPRLLQRGRRVLL
jgi:hypothetical protein